MIAGILVCKLFVAKLCMIILVPLGNTATIQFSTRSHSTFQPKLPDWKRGLWICLYWKGCS